MKNEAEERSREQWKINAVLMGRSEKATLSRGHLIRCKGNDRGITWDLG